METSDSSQKNFLLIISSIVVFFLSLFIINFYTSPSRNSNLSEIVLPTENNVLGIGPVTPQGTRIYISGAKEGYGVSGGIISLSSIDESAVVINSYQYSGNAEVSIYKADEQSLLEYLVHDAEGKQLRKTPDVSRFQFLATENYQVGSASYNANEKRLTLPLSETGIWYLGIKTNNTIENAFVVRSNFGVLLKEGNNELIFWGQDFRTKRSINEGTIKILSLKEGVNELAQTVFDKEGIARTLVSKDADIAIAKIGDDLAIIPINLRYLNTNWNYSEFKPKEKTAQYFIFTDRPLYRPGDKLYFKAVLRDDDDARYSIPSGIVRATISQDWDEKNAIYDKKISISPEGTISDEFKLPEDTKTGYYYLKITLPGFNTAYDWTDGGFSGNNTSFMVEHFRKPEYFLDIKADKKELVSKDPLSITISGKYFSGQSLSGQTVKYKIRKSNYYEYSYLTDLNYYLNDDYQWGYWYGGAQDDIEASVVLDKNGEGIVTPAVEVAPGGKNQVLTIETEYDDGSGTPSFARKNVLLFAGEFDIFRTSYDYGFKINSPVTLPVKLLSHRQTKTNNIKLTAKIHREDWIPYSVENQKYSSYRKEEEDLREISAITNENGEANLQFIPVKKGSYRLTVEAVDQKGNLVSKVFYIWVSEENYSYYYREGGSPFFSINADKEKYFPLETVNLTVNSGIPDQDFFVSIQRERMDRFRVVSVQGKKGVFQIPLVEEDLPNIYINASSFFGQNYASQSLEIPIITDKKKINFTISPDKKIYAPGETVTLNIQSNDLGGNPISADLAVWTIDKALYELVDQKPADIFKTFWRKRYSNTSETHSLQGITALMAEGGGCFKEGTKILMEGGDSKNIEKVEIGDVVLTRKSEKEASLVKAKVIGVHKTKENGLWIINGSLQVTGNHYLFVNNSWITVGDLITGDKLFDKQGKEVLVNSLEWQLGESNVYNLEIEKQHTYFAGGVWVHNQKGGGEARSIFKDTAYWNPNAKTDSSGRLKLQFKLPDNLTTWIITALGTTSDTKAGQSTIEIAVNKDIVIRPILPNVLGKDDQMTIYAQIQNFTEINQEFTADLFFDSGLVKNATYSAVFLNPKETKELSWIIKPEKENPKAKLTFSVRSKEIDKAKDTIIQEIPVRPFGYWDNRAGFGQNQEQSEVKLSSDADINKSKISLSLSSSLIGSLPSAMEYLIGYPYGCVEQTTSRFVPAVIAKMYPEIFSESMKDKNMDEILKKGINRLGSLQSFDGGWSWWNSGASDPFLTVYVLEYLKEAQKIGALVDENIFSKATVYLNQYIIDSQKPPSDLAERKILQIYGLTLLGENKGKTLINDFSFVGQEKNNISLLSLAVINNVKNKDFNSETNGLKKLLSLAKSEGESLYWEADLSERFGSIDTSTAMALRAIAASDPKNQAAGKAARFLSIKRKYDYWSNTFATSQAIRALVDYSNTQNDINPDFAYQVLLDSKEISSGKITDFKALKKIEIPSVQVKKNGSVLEIKKQGEGSIYSLLSINEFRTDRNTKPLSNGLSVTKELISGKGEEYSLAVGDIVDVRIKVLGSSSDEKYLVVADELPAGMVPINIVFKNEQYNHEPYDYNWYTNYGREYTENGIVFSSYALKKGENIFEYKARVVSEGDYTLPPATAGLMYKPEVRGASGVETVSLTKDSRILPGKFIMKKISENKNINLGKILILLIPGLLIMGLAIYLMKLKVKTTTNVEDKPKLE